MSDDVVNIEINGEPYEARPGTMIIETADANGIHIPRFCYHKHLSVAANCRMCLVEVVGAPKPMPACATPVGKDMKIMTRSALALKAQRTVMEFLLINHPLDCPICDQGGECELQDVSMGFGGDVSRFNERKRVVGDPDLGPLIATEMTRCIHCTRCVRFGEEIAGMPELGSTGRGEGLKISTYVDKNLESELSGNAIDVCPVGALTSKPFRFRARAWEMQQSASIGPHDGVGSNMRLHVARGRIMRVVPGENDSINESWLSDRDRFSYEGLYSEDRLTVPMVKSSDRWREVDWETALATAADQLRAAASSGDQKSTEKSRIGAIASPSATLEESYLLQRLMRSLGSSNVDHRLRIGATSDQDEAPVFPNLGCTLTELEAKSAILVIGGHPRKDQPLLNHRLRKAALAGAQIMYLGCMDEPMNYQLGPCVSVAPQRLVGAVAGLLKAAGASTSGALKAAVDDAKSDEILEAMARVAVDASATGASNVAVLLGPDVESHPEGHILRGLARTFAERVGGSLGSLDSGANAAGAWIAGMVPHRLANGAANENPGLDVRQMLDGGVDACVLLGVEPERDCFDPAHALRALREMRSVVCLSAFQTEAMREYATVMLPIAGHGESPGTFVNLEGRQQSFLPAVNPQGDARPAWRVLRVLGNALEVQGFDFMKLGDVTDEINAGAAHPAAEGALPKAQWSGQGPHVRWDDKFVRIGRVPAYSVDALVRRASALQLTPDGSRAPVRFSEATATRIGIDLNGEGASVNTVKVRQNGGEATLRFEIDDGIPADAVFVAAGVAGTEGLGDGYGGIEVEAGLAS